MFFYKLPWSHMLLRSHQLRSEVSLQLASAAFVRTVCSLPPTAVICMPTLLLWTLRVSGFRQIQEPSGLLHRLPGRSSCWPSIPEVSFWVFWCFPAECRAPLDGWLWFSLQSRCGLLAPLHSCVCTVSRSEVETAEAFCHVRVALAAVVFTSKPRCQPSAHIFFWSFLKLYNSLISVHAGFPCQRCLSASLSLSSQITATCADVFTPR